MGDDDHGRAEVVPQAPELVEHDPLVLLVQLGGRLVREHERRPPRRGSGDRDALLLATRERSRPVARALGQPEVSKRLVGSVRQTGEAQREQNVLARAQQGPEVPGLEDESELLGPVVGELGVVQARERATGHAHLAGRRLVQPGGQVEQGRLSRAGRAENCHELAVLDSEIEPAQGDDVRVARAKDLEDVVQLESAPLDLLLALWLLVEAPYLHRKLWIISR